MIKKTESQDGATKVTFVVPLVSTPRSVSVVGDFNGWDPLRHPMQKRSNGTRSVAVELPAGSMFEFKYLDEEGNWFCDPDTDQVPQPAFGCTNSLLVT